MSRPKSTTRVDPWSDAQLDRLIARATEDAYDEVEQRVGFFTMIEGSLGVPFETQVLGADVGVEALDQTPLGEIVATCQRGRARQRVRILDLPLPTPLPSGAKCIEAYRHWCVARGD